MRLDLTLIVLVLVSLCFTLLVYLISLGAL